MTPLRLCRYRSDDVVAIGLYSEESILSLDAVAHLAGETIPASASILDYLPHGKHHAALRSAVEKVHRGDPAAREAASIATGSVQMLVPIPNPDKLLLLAGNYSKHIEEGGGRAAERRETFPYVFMKPPGTTLTNPGDPILIPANSPDQIDWEIELGVVIGKTCRNVKESDALGYVAGYTVINDISDRAFTPNPKRVERPNDRFFDWLHGKWHDTFCPMGPCILSSGDVPDPQQFPLKLSVNGNVEQDSSTSQMVFPIAAVIEFISSFVALKPGDIIATGTPHGVGKAKGRFLKAGDEVEAVIEGIGSLKNPVR